MSGISGGRQFWAEGRFGPTGSTTYATGCTITKGAAGTYIIAFNTPMPDANYHVDVNSITSYTSGGHVLHHAESLSTTGFTIVCWDEQTGSLQDVGCSFRVIRKGK